MAQTTRISQQHHKWRQPQWLDHPGNQWRIAGTIQQGRGWIYDLDPKVIHGIVSVERLKVAGERATWSVVDVPGAFAQSGKQARLYVLVVKCHSDLKEYWFEGITDASDEPNAIQQELLAIRNSLRFEVAPPDAKPAQ